ncbi:MAG: dockerin type I repeat-containing protein [Oscillospiraceae bacterium]|jgi:hypothetical protein|nr:dockerin type I repeat-containing protein [Oscillospiraceae bacterium]
MQKLRVYSFILLSLVIFSINVISDNENNSSLTYKILSSAPNSQNMQVFPDQAGDFITVSDRAISKLNGSTGDITLLAELHNNYGNFCTLTNGKLWGSTSDKTNLVAFNCFAKTFKEYTLDRELPDLFTVVNSDFLIYPHEKNQDSITLQKIGDDGKLSVPQINSVVSESIGEMVAAPSGDSVFVIDSGENRLIELSIGNNGLEGGATVLSPAPEEGFCFLDGKTILDHSGNVYQRSENSHFQKVFSIDLPGDSPAACIQFNFLIAKTSDNTLSCFNLNSETSDAIGYFEFKEEIIGVYASGENAIALLKSTDGKTPHIIQLREQDIINPIIERDTDLETITENEKSEQSPTDDKIHSSTYKINDVSSIIKIPANSSITEVRKNLNFCKSFKIKLIDNNGNEKKSGKTGTGTVIQLLKDGKIVQELTVIVPGDVTGTGTITQNDINAICNHLFGTPKLEGQFLLAGDVNQDGKVDILDLLAVNNLKSK